MPDAVTFILQCVQISVFTYKAMRRELVGHALSIMPSNGLKNQEVLSTILASLGKCALAPWLKAMKREVKLLLSK